MSERKNIRSSKEEHEYRKVEDIIPENYGAFVMTTKQNKEIFQHKNENSVVSKVDFIIIILNM